jgi:hypothetical protein
MYLRFAALSALVLAISTVFATPASAQWSGTPTAVTAGPGEFTLETGKVVKCESAASTKPTSTGIEVNLGTITWNTCDAEVGGVKVSLTIECKDLTLAQPTKEGISKGKATGKIVSLCTLKLTGASCSINIPTKNNQKLSAITLAKEGSNQKDVVEVNPIEATTTGAGCAVAGLAASYTKASLKIPSLVVSNIGLV